MKANYDIKDIEYFNRGQLENPRFWQRFGIHPDFTNTTVIEVGCGHGSLCVEMALSGAKKVIGIDTDSMRIDFAKVNLVANYPNLVNIVDFRIQRLEELPETNIDYFVSKDTFEHILNLRQVLAIMKDKLKFGGYIYTAIGPLWKSPFGDHNKTKMRIPWGPWGHLLFSESYIIQRLNRLYGSSFTSIYDLGLNKLTFDEYITLFYRSQLSIVYLRVNARDGLSRVTSIISSFMTIFRRLPILRDYCTHNVYCILKKDQSS